MSYCLSLFFLSRDTAIVTERGARMSYEIRKKIQQVYMESKKTGTKLTPTATFVRAKAIIYREFAEKGSPTLQPWQKISFGYNSETACFWLSGSAVAVTRSIGTLSMPPKHEAAENWFLWHLKRNNYPDEKIIIARLAVKTIWNHLFLCFTTGPQPECL